MGEDRGSQDAWNFPMAPIVLHPEILPFLPSTVERFLEYILGCQAKRTRESGSKEPCDQVSVMCLAGDTQIGEWL